MRPFLIGKPPDRLIRRRSTHSPRACGRWWRPFVRALAFTVPPVEVKEGTQNQWLEQTPWLAFRDVAQILCDLPIV